MCFIRANLTLVTIIIGHHTSSSKIYKPIYIHNVITRSDLVYKHVRYNVINLDINVLFH